MLKLFDARLAQLDAGREPSGGDQGLRPESAPPPSGGSRATLASAAEHGTPLRHGVHEQTPHRS